MQFEMTVDKTGLLGLAGANRVISEELRDLIHGGALFAQKEIRENAPQGVLGVQGGLRGRIFSEMRGTPLQPIGLVASPSEHSEVMENGRDGFQVPLETVEGLAEHLLRVCSQPRLLAEAGQRAREKVLARFRVEDMCR